ncbi:conserved protein of unknown function [Rhodovastum atsumiense]|uniref:Uncharacterized protein n=1 Tax=Rhodovastum atsumiense TaxID=504468 RepID=A0A5M6IVF3_9PROT|nr:hypothetical protein [Rhodovastum atsumiense]KAA5612290.1 hypothetical protein F1189_10330 [Rhodovastum atsumiense]CAH2601620.1 conserved protein of unknown function [Rhodovastum atsumiense]
MALTDALKARPIREIEGAISEAIKRILEVELECKISSLEFSWQFGLDSVLLSLNLSEPPPTLFEDME